MIKRKKWKLAVCLLLTSCATPEEIAAAKQARMQADYDTCVEDYGFHPNSDGVRNCMLQLELARQYEQTVAYSHHSYYGHGPHFGSGLYYLHH